MTGNRVENGKIGFELNNPDIEAANRRFVFWLGVATICLLFLFSLFPQMDLSTARYLAGLGKQHPDRVSIVKEARDLAYSVMIIYAILLASAIFTSLASNKRFFGQDWRALVYAGLACALGPGLLVNGILKEMVPRARPKHLAEFGGSMDFNPVLDFAGKCTGNCSFVSGEVAMITAMFGVWVFVASGRTRKIFLALSLVSAALVGFARMFVAAHFLSDVVLAWCFTMLACGFVWYWCYHTAWSIFVNLQKGFEVIGKPLKW